MSDPAAPTGDEGRDRALDARTTPPTQPMPLRAHHRTPPSTALRRPTQTVADVPFDDLVFLLAAGVADAQTALDAHTAETVRSLAATEVEVVPSVTKTIDADGTVSTDAAPAERRSLLELGFSPAHYRFSDATVDVEVDVSVTEGPGDETAEFRADTQSVIDRRRFDRRADANARVVARLEPTPLPVRADASQAAGDASGGDRAD